MLDVPSKLPHDIYDDANGDRAKVPDQPVMSDAEKWGTNLNPVRETPTPFKNTREA